MLASPASSPRPRPERGRRPYQRPREGVSGPGQDLARGAILERASLMKHEDAGRETFDGSKVVADEHRCPQSAPGGQQEVSQNLEKPSRRGTIQGRSRLIQHQGDGLHGQRTGQHEALAMPTGELERTTSERLRGQTETGEQAGTLPRVRERGEDLSPRHPRVERFDRILKDERNPPAKSPVGGPQPLSQHPHLAGRRRRQAHEDTTQRALSGPARADNAKDLAVVDGDMGGVEYGPTPEGAREAPPLEHAQAQSSSS